MDEARKLANEADANVDEAKGQVGWRILIRERAVQQLARKLLAKASPGQVLSQVDRARFFFTWICHSIEYDDRVKGEGLVDNRSAALALLRGFEVCHGYAHLFAGMFNTDLVNTDPEILKRAMILRGVGNVQCQKQENLKAFEDSKNQHVWNAFPTEDGKWKLIDTTWGACRYRDKKMLPVTFLPWWFTVPNEEFDKSHFPLLEGKSHPSKENQAKVNIYMKGQRSRYHKWDKWIDVEWPQLLREIQHQVDPATILPRTYGIERRSWTHFKCNFICKHYIGPKYLMALDLSGNDKPTLEQIVRLDPMLDGWDKLYQCSKIGETVTYIRLVCIGIVTKEGFQPLKDWKQLDGDGVQWQAKGVAKWRILTNGQLPKNERPPTEKDD